ncbi:MAG: cupin domain-containing protein [Dissulfurimicrobium sp.]
MLVTLAPGARTREDRQHQGEEFGFMLTGKAMLGLGRQGYELEEGDCF